jgi:hypothetical protein
LINKLKIVLLFSFFVIGYSSYSQSNEVYTLTGIVKDFSTKSTISDAVVSLNKSKNKVITNKEGYFLIESTEKEVRLIVSFLGYQSYDEKISLKKNNQLQIDLKRKEIDIKEITVSDKKKSVFKQSQLYDIEDTLNEANIDGFYALNLFSDALSKEIWFTENKKCIDAAVDNINKYKGNNALHIKWDKISGGCNWIGMGIGWNGWQGKDISGLVGKAAIQFFARTKGDTLKGLPLALALEDYSGVQAYTGFSPSFIEGGKITANWTKISIPFNVFPIAQTDLDIFNIKQFIMQFEAEGDLIIDEITIVPFEGILKPKFDAYKVSSKIIIDGRISDEEWGRKSLLIDDLHKININYDDENLFIAATIFDKHPLINNQNDNEIWNGDALEISFGTNASADINRTRYLWSDFQIGIKATDKQPYVWNWKKKSIIAAAEVKINKTDYGYQIELKIPFSSIGDAKMIKGEKYGFEIAIDDGDASGKRIKQTRWASPQQEGFNINPSLWGLINLN